MKKFLQVMGVIFIWLLYGMGVALFESSVSHSVLRIVFFVLMTGIFFTVAVAIENRMKQKEKEVKGD
jgi:hypothetical protein